MKLSLCMIVKNEENNLPRCLESVRDVADEMIIVDTGSTDRTVEIAESFGATVLHFPWNGSFADARNYSLNHADGDWILIMDADDEMAPETRERIPELLYGDADAYYFETISYVGDKPGSDVLKNLNLRLMRNNRGYYYTQPIHEQIYSNILAANPEAKIVNLDLKVYHYGYLNKNIAEHGKRARNISLLEKELAEKPGSAFTCFNLASEYYAMGDNVKAIGLFEQAHRSFNPLDGFSSHLILKMSHCYLTLGRFSEALSAVEEGLSYYPDFTDLVYIRASIYFAQNRPYDAIRAFKRCIDMGEAPNNINVLIGAGTYRPKVMIGHILYSLGDYESAMEEMELAFCENPAISPQLLPDYVRCCCRVGLGNGDILERVALMREECPEDADDSIYKVLADECRCELALNFIDGDTPEGLFARGMCELCLKKYDEAYKTMALLKKQKLYTSHAACIQSLALVCGGQLRRAEKLFEAKSVSADSPPASVYRAFIKLIRTGETDVLCEDEALAQSSYTPFIFSILRTLLVTGNYILFENALPLLNSVSDKTALLKLAKLYYSQEHYSLAYKEMIRSIRDLDVLDKEGAEILFKLKKRGF